MLHHFFQARWASLLSGGLIVLLCWLLAQWTWLVLTPKSKPAAAGAELLSAQAAADAIFAGHLFGLATEGGGEPEARQATVSNLKLHGVFAAIGSLPAFAILGVDGKPDQPVKAGAEITPGLVLEAVYPDHVAVRRQGVMERLDLDARAAGPNGVPGAPDFRLNVQSRAPGSYSFSRSELSQALQDPKQLANLGKFAVRTVGKGMAVEDAPHGSLADKMGLQQGDVVLTLNGQAVASNEDIGRFYQQMNQAGKVRLTGLRGGKPLLLDYAIQ